MDNELQPYQEYVDVNLPWLERIPEHWKIVSNKVLWCERNMRNHGDESLLSVTIKRGVISQQELIRSTAKKDSSNDDKDKYKLVLPNDIVYNKMRMWQGAVGISKYRGIVSSAYIILKPKVDFNPKYYHFLLRTPEYVGESYRFSYGICDDQLSLRYEDFKGMNTIFPPQEEQDQIVRFLDSKVGKINRIIKLKKQQIELLKEQRKVIINQAVTKGLDLDVEMKPSGIDWLGDIPAHWRIQKFSRVAEVKSNLVDPGAYLSHPQVSPANIEKDTGILGECQTVHESGVISDNHLFRKGQILYSKIRPKLNKVTIAPFEGLCSADMYPIETRLDTTYLLYFMLSATFLAQLSVTDNRVKMPKINKEELGSIVILEPPAYEQEDIVENLRQEQAFIQRAIDRKEHVIALLGEYRTTLISNVVTGKVDVRGIEVDEVDDLLEQSEDVEDEECLDFEAEDEGEEE